MAPHSKRSSRSALDSIVIAVLIAVAAIVIAGLFIVLRDRGVAVVRAERNSTRIAIVTYNETAIAGQPTIVVVATLPPAVSTPTASTPDTAPSSLTPFNYASVPAAQSITPAVTSAAISTVTPTATPARPAILALPGLVIPPSTRPTDSPEEPATSTTFTPYPTYVPITPVGAGGGAPGIADDVLNILLIGSDQRPEDTYYRTDTLLIVSINRTVQTVAMLSIPRDLYVNIPGHGLDRINTAYEWGEIQRAAGGGIGLLTNTITAVTGVPIQRYAKIDFSGFKQIVDGIGGVDVANDCPLSDYRLVPGLKEGVEANYRWSTLPVGVFHFGGIDALWYARSRMTTNDFDRARRQQSVLRAIYRKAFEGGLLNKLPGLWPDLINLVSTDLTLTDIASLLPLAAEMDASRMRSYVIGPPAVADSITASGAAVLIPQPKAISAIVARFSTPPTNNALFAERPTIEVWNNSSHSDWDEVAAGRLAWEGFVPLLKGLWTGDPAVKMPGGTTLFDYTGKAKPASLSALTSIFALRSNQVIAAPDPNAANDFRLIIGDNYVSCTYR